MYDLNFVLLVVTWGKQLKSLYDQFTVPKILPMAMRFCWFWCLLVPYVYPQTNFPYVFVWVGGGESWEPSGKGKETEESGPLISQAKWRLRMIVVTSHYLIISYRRTKFRIVTSHYLIISYRKAKFRWQHKLSDCVFVGALGKLEAVTHLLFSI